MRHNYLTKIYDSEYFPSTRELLETRDSEIRFLTGTIKKLNENFKNYDPWITVLPDKSNLPEGERLYEYIVRGRYNRYDRFTKKEAMDYNVTRFLNEPGK